MAIKRRDTKLSKHLREMLGRPAPVELQDEAELLSGEPGKTNAEQIAERVIAAARDGKEWAIQLVYERTEGKAAVGGRVDEPDRTVEDKINDAAKSHLNSLAGFAAASTEQRGPGATAPAAAPQRPDPLDDDEGEGGDGPDADPAEQPAAPARRLLDLPKDRPDHPQAP